MIDERMDRLEADLRESARLGRILSEAVVSHEGRVGSMEDRTAIVEQKIEILIDNHMRLETQVGLFVEATREYTRGVAEFKAESRARTQELDEKVNILLNSQIRTDEVIKELGVSMQKSELGMQELEAKLSRFIDRLGGASGALA
jgi:hypothetical protein